MLANHGYTKATFSGHSFGTFWMSYMAKYAPEAVAGLVFLDPVCFCLHNSSLTRSVVYNAPDPGDIGRHQRFAHVSVAANRAGYGTCFDLFFK